MATVTRIVISTVIGKKHRRICMFNENVANYNESDGHQILDCCKLPSRTSWLGHTFSIKEEMSFMAC
jgi:hypothetical protein